MYSTHYFLTVIFTDSLVLLENLIEETMSSSKTLEVNAKFKTSHFSSCLYFVFAHDLWEADTETRFNARILLGNKIENEELGAEKSLGSHQTALQTYPWMAGRGKGGWVGHIPDPQAANKEDEARPSGGPWEIGTSQETHASLNRHVLLSLLLSWWLGTALRNMALVKPWQWISEQIAGLVVIMLLELGGHEMHSHGCCRLSSHLH